MSGEHPIACRKCGQVPYIIIDRVHVECKGCFIDSCIRKFRQSIGKSKLVKNNDSLLVAYSGGQSSCALLDMMKSRLDSNTGLEPKFRPSILHIDMQSTLCNSSLSETQTSRTKNLVDILCSLKQKYPDWPVYWTSIEASMANSNDTRLYEIYKSSEDIDTNKGSHLLADEAAHLRLQEELGKFCDLTDRQRFVTERCKDLLIRVALELNANIQCESNKIKYVLVGSSATQLANNLLVDVILGRGSTIRSTVSVSDERQIIPILRPMRDFSKKEIVFYLRAKNIDALTQPNFLTMADRKACIQTLTETFLSKLYVDYPATYSTLLKTGEKLA